MYCSHELKLEADCSLTGSVCRSNRAQAVPVLVHLSLSQSLLFYLKQATIHVALFSQFKKVANDCCSCSSCLESCLFGSAVKALCFFCSCLRALRFHLELNMETLLSFSLTRFSDPRVVLLVSKLFSVSVSERQLQGILC